MATAGAIVGYVILALAIAIIAIAIIVCVVRAVQRRRAAHKFTLFEDERSVSVAADMHQVQSMEAAAPEPSPKQKKNRLPLANQFSAAAALNDAATPSQKPTIFTHSIQSADSYIWPSKGGSAVPVDIEWGRVGSPSANKKNGV